MPIPRRPPRQPHIQHTHQHLPMLRLRHTRRNNRPRHESSAQALPRRLPMARRFHKHNSRRIQTPHPKTQNPFDAARYARFFEHPWLSDEAQRFLFEERRLDPRVVAWCRLTSWTDRQGIHWLQTPFFDQSRNLIGLQNRSLDLPHPPKSPTSSSPPELIEHPEPLAPPVSSRFRFPHGARCSIYNLPVIPMLRPAEPLYITEGCSDCWSMLSSGHKAVAIPSATLLTQADKQLLRDLFDRLGTTFHMYPDRDTPGERLFMQLKEVLPSLEHHQLPPGCKDFSDYYVSSIKTKTT